MFEISTIPDSDSDSECELPKFDIPAFKKYESIKSKEISQSSLSNKSIASVCKNGGHSSIQEELKQRALDETLKHSIMLQPGFSQLNQVPVFQSIKKIKKDRLKDRDKTTGPNWFDMPAPEMTEEAKNDLLAIQMRQALDPKRFYKRSAAKINPKYFQIGTFEESPVDFYSSRIPKKQRKQTLVDELLADAEFRNYQKKKYNEILKTQPAKRFVKRKKGNKNEAKDKSMKKKSKKNKK